MQVHLLDVIGESRRLHRIEWGLLLLADRSDNLRYQKVGETDAVEARFVEYEVSLAIGRDQVSPNHQGVDSCQHLAEQAGQQRIVFQFHKVKVDACRSLQARLCQCYLESLEAGVVVWTELEFQKGVELIFGNPGSVLPNLPAGIGAAA